MQQYEQISDIILDKKEPRAHTTYFNSMKS